MTASPIEVNLQEDEEWCKVKAEVTKEGTPPGEEVKVEEEAAASSFKVMGLIHNQEEKQHLSHNVKIQKITMQSKDNIDQKILDQNLLKRMLKKHGIMKKGKKINIPHQMPSLTSVLKIIKKSPLHKFKPKSPQRSQFLYHALKNLLTLTKILLRM